MLSKHIDVIALLVIVAGLLAFSKAPELRFVPEVNAAGIGIQNKIDRLRPCPLSEALFARWHRL